jgi:hypothetical protein
MRVDMSPKAVTVRLKRVSQLRRLCLSLGKAQPAEAPVGPTSKSASTLKDEPRTDVKK